MMNQSKKRDPRFRNGWVGIEDAVSIVKSNRYVGHKPKELQVGQLYSIKGEFEFQQDEGVYTGMEVLKDGKQHVFVSGYYFGPELTRTRVPVEGCRVKDGVVRSDTGYENRIVNFDQEHTPIVGAFLERVEEILPKMEEGPAEFFRRSLKPYKSE